MPTLLPGFSTLDVFPTVLPRNVDEDLMQKKRISCIHRGEQLTDRLKHAMFWQSFESEDYEMNGHSIALEKDKENVN